MNIAVLNGSPKGNNSVTLQSVEYLKRYASETASFTVFNVGQRIKALSNPDYPEKLDEVMNAMIQADLILFCYPVYTCLAPYQLAQFIRLMKEHPRKGELKGKFVSQLTTSMHFYDYTAHRYIVENCEDLDMRTLEGLSAEMEDLLSGKGQRHLRDFFGRLCFGVDQQLPAYSGTVPAEVHDFCFEREEPVRTVCSDDSGDTVIVTDCRKDNRGLNNMIASFIDAYPGSVRLVNINDFAFKGGCLGCFQCSVTADCVYTDGFQNILRDEIQSSRAIIYAFSIVDHSMGPLFKCYDDRQFCNGHRTVTKGIYTAYLVQGKLRGERNLIDLIEARAEVGECYLAGIACDESYNDEQTHQSIADLARNLTYALEKRWEKPRNFFGVGGMKIFRDLIFLMRGLMKADHAFYKKHGHYDFPHNRVGRMILMQVLGFLMMIPSVRKRAQKEMTGILLKPYKKVLAGVKRN